MPKDVTTGVHKDIHVSTGVIMNVHEDAGGRPLMCDITGVPNILWTANGVFKNVFVENMNVHACLMDASEYSDGVYGRNFVKWWTSKRAVIGFQMKYIGLPQII